MSRTMSDATDDAKNAASRRSNVVAVRSHSPTARPLRTSPKNHATFEPRTIPTTITRSIAAETARYASGGRTTTYEAAMSAA
jgi:hypothetical protein